MDRSDRAAPRRTVSRPPTMPIAAAPRPSPRTGRRGICASPPRHRPRRPPASRGRSGRSISLLSGQHEPSERCTTETEIGDGEIRGDARDRVGPPRPSTGRASSSAPARSSWPHSGRTLQGASAPGPASGGENVGRSCDQRILAWSAPTAGPRSRRPLCRFRCNSRCWPRCPRDRDGRARVVAHRARAGGGRDRC